MYEHFKYKKTGWHLGLCPGPNGGDYNNPRLCSWWGGASRPFENPSTAFDPSGLADHVKLA